MMMPYLLRDLSEFCVAHGDLITLLNVGTHDLPFLIREFSRLVEYLHRNSYLPYVMEQTKQRQLALLDIREFYSFTKLSPHLLCTTHMLFRIAVALLKSPYE